MVKFILDNFDTIFRDEKSFETFDKMILDLAVRGKFVPQIEDEEPASKLLEKIKEEKERLIAEKVIKKEKLLPSITEDEKPYDIPDSWEWVRLGAIISLSSGQDIPLNLCNDIGDGIPYLLGASNIKNNNIIIERWIKNPRVIASKGDLLISCKGTVGKLIINPLDEINLSRQLMGIKNIFKILNINFLLIFFKNYVDELKEKSQGLIPGISRDDILLIKFPLPPLKEQERIVGKVEKLQKLSKKFKEIYNSNEKTRANLKKSILEEIEKSDTNNKLLISLEKLFGNFEKVIKTKEDVKDIRNLVLALAVRGKLVPQIEDEEPASKLLEKIKEEKERLIAEKVMKKEKPLPLITEDEKPYDIPTSWEWVRLKDIGQIIGGGTPKTERTEYWNGSIPWLTPADLNGYKDKYISFGKRFITDLGLKESSAQLLKEGTILFSSRAPIGYVAIAKNNLATNQGFKSISLFETKSKEYLYYYLKKIAKIVNDNASGTTFKEISGADVGKILFPLPPLEEQERIVKRVDELMAVCDALESKIEIGEKINRKLLASLLKK